MLRIAVSEEITFSSLSSARLSSVRNWDTWLQLRANFNRLKNDVFEMQLKVVSLNHPRQSKGMLFKLCFEKSVLEDWTLRRKLSPLYDDGLKVMIVLSFTRLKSLHSVCIRWFLLA